MGFPAQQRGHHTSQDADDQGGRRHVYGGDAELDGKHAARALTSRKQAKCRLLGYTGTARGNRGPAVHSGGPSVLQRQGGPPRTGTPWPNEPAKGAVAQRRRGVLRQHPAVSLPAEHRGCDGPSNQGVCRRNCDGLQWTAACRLGGGRTWGGPNDGDGPP